MKITVLNKISFCAYALFISTAAFAMGGGGDDDGGSGGDNGGGLPAPDTCSFNCGYEQGPNPSLSFLQASRGPFSIRSTTVSSSVNGFGGGTIYFPRNISSEMATIAVAPGFNNRQSAIAWWGPILASHGFVVITIDTNSRFDQPDSRSRQLDSALSYLISEGKRSGSLLRGRVDENRLAVMGFSMGGGGALRSAARNRVSAAIPLAPFRLGGNDFNQIRVPTMILACENDNVARVSRHASPFYNAIPNSTDKVFLEINDGPHNCANGNNANTALLSTYGVSWMKRFLDKDRRFNPFLCGPNHEANPRISEFRDTCNF